MHGTITIEGPVGETLSDVWLEVWDNGAKIATAQLARAAPVSDVRSQLLNKPFVAESQGGTLGKLTVPELSPGIAPVLFEFNAASLSAIDQSQDSLGLVLQVHAKLPNGEEIRYFDVPGVFEKLVQYTGLNRYGGRDSGDCIGLPTVTLPLVPTDPKHLIRWMAKDFPCGGDSWARPSTANWIGTSEAGTAGHYPPHSSHAIGEDVDVKWPALTTCSSPPCLPWFNVTKLSAEKLIALFSSPEGAAIDYVYVTFAANANNAFWTTVRNEKVGGVRLIPEDVAADAELKGASDPTGKIWSKGRIGYRPAHEKHFHINWID